MATVLEHEPALPDGCEAPPRCRPRDRLQARGRGAVVSGLALFVGLQIAAAAVIEGFPELRDPVFEIKYRRLTTHLGGSVPPPGAVVFLGSSMSANGIKAAIVGEPLSMALGRPVVAYTLAANAAGPVNHLVFLNRLLRRGIRPELVVVELSPLFYDVAQTRLDLRRNAIQSLEYADLDALARHGGPADMRLQWWRTNLVPTYGHRMAILNQSLSVVVPFDDRLDLWSDADAHGWRPRPAASPSERALFMQALRDNWVPRLPNYQKHDAPLAALREIAEVLARERIAALFVIMPEGPMLRSFYGPGVDVVLADFATICRAHGIPLVNARAWFDEDQFRDSYHLHDQGAARFTVRLLREGIIPVLVPSWNSAAVSKSH